MNNIQPIIKQVIRLLSFLVDDCADTYSEWLQEWFQLYKRDRLKDRTMQSMSDYIEKRILPELGNFKLTELSSKHLQKFVNSIESGNTRHKLSFILNASLRKAVAFQKILYNPFDAVEIQGYHKGHYRKLEFDEQNMIWNYYCNPIAYYNYLDVTPYKSLFFFMCCTGMRVGEFLALDWNKDFNPHKFTINISKSMDKETKVISTPKSECSNRVLKVLPALMPYIEVISKNEYTYYGISEHFRKLYKRLNIQGATVHSFRHTFTSMAYAAGIREKYIQLYLGHADITTTLNTYTHYMEPDAPSVMYEYIQDLAEYLQRR